MNKYLYSFMFLLTFLTIGCSPEEENDSPIIEAPSPDNDEQDNNSEEPRYYVKYEVYMPLGNSNLGNTSRRITFVSEDGERTLSTSNSEWEGTYGPLQKGSKLYLKVEAESGGIRTNVEYYARLSVSRDKEPFVIKGEQRAKRVSTLYTSYTIDF